MLDGSAAFATPFGEQANVLVYPMSGEGCGDVPRVGLPLDFFTSAAAIVAVQACFPF